MNTTTTSVLKRTAIEPEEELFMIPDEVSAVLHLSRSDLRRMRDAGTGPAYFAIGSTIRYLPADVDVWRRSHPAVDLPRNELGSSWRP